MSLFQNSVLKKYLKGIDSEKAETAWNAFKSHFHNTEIQENIRNSKEEQYQGEFLIDLFVNVFGYVKNPNPNFNLTTELKNIKGAKKTDGAILQDEKAIAVIELKGTNTVDLAKVEKQAFGYKNNQPGCTYVITSNFEKLRFYIDNAVEFEEFNLFQITKERFDTLYLCLSEDNLLKGIPKQIKDESLTREETVTKQLYKDYSQFRNEIFDDIQKQNSEYDKLTLFKKTQKLLDRFLFVFFAEDRLLLPPNSIREIVTQWTDLRDKYDEYQPLYNRFKKYFGYMNTGYEGKKYEIFAYNGGLFSPDQILDTIKISDDLLYQHTVNLSNYDFESEVSVNILGHIFEHSLTEIETIQAQLEGQEIDKNKTKRKKDGVFYTPKYITKYIVDNTVGQLCNDKKTEIGIDETEFEKERKGRKQSTLKKLSKQLDDYREWLLRITICDPACGSGAFLNQSLEFLISEHAYVDELKAKLLGDAMIFSEVQNDILENNIFGVDINQESVEIAKLSLWLRTAKKGRKLTTLNDNIKCGNSLVNFNWEVEFEEVFNSGGFDVVLGNPPYIKEATNKNAFDGLHQNLCYQGKMDLWYFFGALALDIVKKDYGLIGYIAPNNWITNDGASKFRNYVIQNGKIIEFIDFGNFKVFDSAGIQTMIYIMQRTDDNTTYDLSFSKVIDSKIKHEDAKLFLKKLEDEKFEYFQSEVKKEDLENEPINFINEKLIKLIDRISTKGNFNLTSKEIASGIDLLQDFVNKKHKEVIGDVEIGEGIFNLSQSEYEGLNLNEKEIELIKPFYTTTELLPFYGNPKNRLWIIYTNSSFKNEENILPYPNIKNHLDRFKKVLTSVNKPYGLHRSRDENYFKGEKIFSLRKCSVRPRFTYTEFDTYVNRTFMVIKTERINQKYLTGILNSNLLAFWLKYKGKMQGNNYQIDKTPLERLPLIKPVDKIVKEIADLVDTVISGSQKLNDYKELLESSISNNEFDREIRLKKEIQKLEVDINLAKNKINAIVYELYEIKSSEIPIIENQIN
jgi:hypothetical protein